MTAKELYEYAKSQRLNKVAWLQNILSQEAILGRYCTEFAEFELDADCYGWLSKNGFYFYHREAQTGGLNNVVLPTIVVCWHS